MSKGETKVILPALDVKLFVVAHDRHVNVSAGMMQSLMILILQTMTDDTFKVTKNGLSEDLSVLTVLMIVDNSGVIC